MTKHKTLISHRKAHIFLLPINGYQSIMLKASDNFSLYNESKNIFISYEVFDSKFLLMRLENLYL